MNNNHNGNHSGDGGFFNGLLIGLLIGGGAVFLLGTKKGKKLLKIITEEGMEGISEIGDLLEDETEEYEEPVYVEHKQKPPQSKPQENLKEETHRGESPVNKVTSSAKRFFKGIRKKS